MNLNKLYNIYINFICKKFYLIAIIYLFLHLFFLYINIELSHFIFIFKLEKFNYIELTFYIILNFLCIFITQLIISKILLKYNFFVPFTLIFIIPLCISILYFYLDIIYFDLYYVYENRNIIVSYILKYI
jgi:hypothetical protein